MSDVNNNLIAISAKDATLGSMPYYGTLTLSNFMVFSPVHNSDVGNHTFSVTLTDSITPRVANFTLSIVNNAPTYASGLVS